MIEQRSRVRDHLQWINITGAKCIDFAHDQSDIDPFGSQCNKHSLSEKLCRPANPFRRSFDTEFLKRRH